jgi:hypothetical protein
MVAYFTVRLTPARPPPVVEVCPHTAQRMNTNGGFVFA